MQAVKNSAAGTILAMGARRRRKSFASAEDASSRLASKPGFKAFTAGSLAAYIKHDLEPVNGVTHTCRRQCIAASPQLLLFVEYSTGIWKATRNHE
jgi:hypothetical protein